MIKKKKGSWTVDLSPSTDPDEQGSSIHAHPEEGVERQRRQSNASSSSNNSSDSSSSDSSFDSKACDETVGQHVKDDPNGRSFLELFQPAKSFDEWDGGEDGSMLLNGVPISVRIINVEESRGTRQAQTPAAGGQTSSPSSLTGLRARHIFSPYLYEIEVTHGLFKWRIKKRWYHVYQLHSQLLLYRASLQIPFPTERRRTLKIKGFHIPSLPKVPRIVDPFGSGEEHLKKLSSAMEQYLNRLLKHPSYRNNHHIMEFLEISPLSFIRDTGPKGKEGLVRKRAGGHRTAACCVRFQNLFTDFCGHWRRRWLICKDTYVLYVRPRDGRIRAVLLMDSGFRAEFGQSKTGVIKGIKITNLSRDLIVKCWTERKAKEWVDCINNMAATIARPFTQINRYDSFAPERQSIQARWLVDGASYMAAVAQMIDLATEEIFIAGWHVSPEIYLKRPMIEGDKWRLDYLLERKAAAGVKVFILVYKEVELALGINSLHSKRALIRRHPNIRVLRHPDPVISGTVGLWSHHEKLVIVDQSWAFVGGCDLCFGRWDDYRHRVTDTGGIELSLEQSLQGPIRTSSGIIESHIVKSRSTSKLDEVSDEKNLNSLPISAKTKGVVQEALLSQLGAIKSLTDKMAADQEEYNQQIKQALTPEKKPPRQEEDEKSPSSSSTIERTRLRSQAAMIQAVAKFKMLKRRRKLQRQGSISSELELEGRAMPLVEEESLVHKRSESEAALDQFSLKGGAKLWLGKDYCNFIIRDLTELNEPFKDLVDRNTTPRMPWHDLSCLISGPAARDVARHFIQRWNSTKLEKAKSIDRYPWLIPKSYDSFPEAPSSSSSKKAANGSLWSTAASHLIPSKKKPSLEQLPQHPLAASSYKVSCQVLRSVAPWSIGIKVAETSITDAMIDLINQARHYIYIENQFFVSSCIGSNNGVLNHIAEALFQRILIAAKHNEVFRVFILIPLLPAFEGQVGTDRGAAIQAIIHYEYESIARGPNSLFAKLEAAGVDYRQYVGIYSLRNHGTIHGRLVTELVYVHSKLLIVDDIACIIGSANINDRSLLGYRDSEVAVVIRDEQFEAGLMNGQPYSSGKFCGSLRRRLFREHLGLLPNQRVDPLINNNNPREGQPPRSPTSPCPPYEEIDLRDPVCAQFYEGIWLSTAALNTSIYEQVFGVIPCDSIRTFAQLEELLNKKKLATTDPDDARSLLARIRGHLVHWPLHFLEEQNLQPPSGTKESLVPISIWT